MSFAASQSAVISRTSFQSRVKSTTCRKTGKVSRAMPVANMDKQSEGPSQVAMKVFGALAAAQMAFGGAAHADIIADVLPESAKSESARAEINRKTSDLPTLKDVGKSLTKDLGFGSSGSDVGRAIDQNTPNLPSAGKIDRDVKSSIGRATPSSVKGFGADLKQKVKEAASAIDRNTPDLPSPGQVGKDIKKKATDLVSFNFNPFQKTQSIGSDVKQAGRDVASGARQLDRDAKRQVGKAASNLPSAGQLDRDAKRTVGKAVGSDVTSAVKDAGRDISRKAGDLKKKVGNAVSFNPSQAGKEISDSAKGFTSDLKQKGREAARSVDRNTPDLPSAGQVDRDVKSSIGRATPDLPSSIKDAGRDISRKAGDLKKKATDVVSFNPGQAAKEATENVKDFGSDLKQKAGEVAGAIDRNTPDLPSAGKVDRDIKSSIGRATPDVPTGVKNLGDDVQRKARDLTSLNPGKDVDQYVGEAQARGDAPPFLPNMKNTAAEVQQRGRDVKGLAGDVGSDIKSSIGRATPDLPDVPQGIKNIGGDIQQKGRDLAGAVTQNTPDLPSAGQIGSEIQKNTPDLPSPQGLFDKLQGK